MGKGMTVTPVDEITAAQRFQIVELLRRTEVNDGLSPLNEAGQLALNHPSAHTVHVMAHHDTHVYGYGQLLAGPRADEGDHDFVTGQLFVDPEHRSTGLGKAILGELERASERTLQLWALGNLPGAQALAASAGYTSARELLIMTKSLTAPMPKPDLPGGFEIRPFRVGTDEAQFLEINARAFAHHPEQGQLTLDDLRTRMAEPWFDPAGFFVAVRGSTMAGFHWTKRHSVVQGEVYVLGVDPATEGRGLGQALLQTGLNHLRASGLTEALLYVEGDHARAVRLYEARGFTVANRDVMYAQSGTAVSN